MICLVHRDVESLVEDNLPLAAAMVRRLRRQTSLLGRDEAMSLAQEGLFEAARQAAADDTVDFTAMARTIICRSIKHAAKRTAYIAKKRSGLLLELLTSQDDPESGLDNADALEAIRGHLAAAMGCLSERERRLVSLRYGLQADGERMAVQAMALAEGLSPEAARWAVQQAEATLRLHLMDRGFQWE